MRERDSKSVREREGERTLGKRTALIQREWEGVRESERERERA